MPTPAAFEGHPGQEQARPLGPVDTCQEDAFWRSAFWREHYYNPDLDYEDYAPAYCVGYIGYAQYGGDYEEAEKSLCANWVRIKGDSRLPLEHARLAMRSAWDRMAGREARESVKKALAARLRRKRLRMPSFRLGSILLR